MPSSISSIQFQEVAASMMSQLSAQDAPRAMLVSLSSDGTLKTQRVDHGKSVLNIDTELLDHLSSQPLSAQFLQDLRDYCDGRLAARAEAKRTGGVVMPRAGGWNILHVNVKEVK